jgi:hypothetical protein
MQKSTLPPRCILEPASGLGVLERFWQRKQQVESPRLPLHQTAAQASSMPASYGRTDARHSMANYELRNVAMVLLGRPGRTRCRRIFAVRVRDNVGGYVCNASELPSDYAETVACSEWRLRGGFRTEAAATALPLVPSRAFARRRAGNRREPATPVSSLELLWARSRCRTATAVQGRFRSEWLKGRPVRRSPCELLRHAQRIERRVGHTVLYVFATRYESKHRNS